MDSLDATLDRVLYQAPAKFDRSGMNFVIGKCRCGTIVKGKMYSPTVGETFRFYGAYRDQKPPYEQAFEFEEFEPLVDRTTQGIAAYLARNVKMLGPARSEALVEEFGLDTIDVLRRDADAARKVAGITEKTVAAIKAHFDSAGGRHAAAKARLSEMFGDYKFPKRVISKLVEWFGDSAPQVVAQRPYLLLAVPRVGWTKVDTFALTEMKYDRDGLDRHVAAIVEGLEQLGNDGHTWAAGPDVEAVAFTLLGGRLRPDAWAAACGSGDVVEIVDESRVNLGYALATLAEAEATVADRLVRLMRTARPMPCAIDLDGLQGEQVDAARLIEANGTAILGGPPGTGKSYLTSKILGSLVRAQVGTIKTAAPTGKAAKRLAELIAQNVPEAAPSAEEVPCVPCGGSGRQAFDDNGLSLAIDATGDCPACDGIGSVPSRGGIPSTTIHRLLKPKPSDNPTGVPAGDAKVNRGREEFTFGHNERSPIQADFLVIDEFSMVDIKLAASLLRAVADGTRLLIVGDQNQLPSVGPGSVLRDISDALPSAYLSQIRRSQPGRVVRACHAILKGEVPEPGRQIDLAGGENWVHMEMNEPHEIARTIGELHKATGTFPDPVWDIQVVTPQKTRLAVACDNLNAILSARLNPRPDGAQHGDDDDSIPYRVGDKVVRTKNGLCDLMTDVGEPMDFDWSEGVYAHEDEDRRVDWHWRGRDYKFKEVDIVNGDLGQVLDIVDTPRDTYAVVKFRNPDRLCRLAAAASKSHLMQAYAMTCHRAQGSGFPFVIVPVHHCFYWDAKEEKGIFSREWLYTAMSRAEKLLVTVGTYASIEAAVKRKTIHKRKTRLAELIRAAMNQTQATENLSACSEEVFACSE